MIDWIKPSGLEIKTNEDKATVAHCEKLGWERVEDVTDVPFIRDDLNVEQINGMSGKDMKRLDKQLNLGVDAKLLVADMRIAMIDALFKPE